MLYNIITNITSSNVDIDRLDSEISSSSISSVLTRIEVTGLDLDIIFGSTLSAEDELILDAIVLAHSGEPMPEEEEILKVDLSHAIEMKTLMAEGGKRKTDRGFSFTVTAGTTHTHDYSVNADLQIKGGIMFSDNSNILDHVSLEIVDTSFLYAGEWYSAEYAPGIPWSVALPSGVPLHMYVGNFPVSPSGETSFDNDAITTTPLNGLTIRVTYKSVGVTDVNCNVGIVAYT